MEQHGSKLYTKMEEEFFKSLESAPEYYASRLAQGLNVLTSIQSNVSSPLIREDTSASAAGLKHREWKEHIRTYGLALMMEVGELINELDWKPWKFRHEVDFENVVKEYSDVLAFLGIVTLLLERRFPGFTTAVAARKYIDVSLDNVERIKGNRSQYGME